MTGSDVKSYFIIWKYAPELLPEKNISTFQELANRYSCFKNGTTEDGCNAWLIVDDKVQRAVKWLVGRLHQQRILELYDKFYHEALEGDIKAFNAITKFSKDYFVDDNIDDMSAFLRGITLPDKAVSAEENDNDDIDDIEDFDEDN